MNFCEESGTKPSLVHVPTLCSGRKEAFPCSGNLLAPCSGNLLAITQNRQEKMNHAQGGTAGSSLRLAVSLETGAQSG